MQLSQFFRRGVIVPLDDEAEAEVRAWYVSDSSRFRFLPIKDDAEFDALWDSGMFSSLNSVCGSLIDDYEEELLEPDILDRAIAVLSKEFASLPTPELCRFRDSLLALLVDAREKHRPAVFIL